MKNTPSPKPPENKSQIQKELELTKVIHDALLELPPDRRAPILQAITILLQIYIPRD